MIQLPSQKTSVQTNISRQKFLLYGQPKVGKSTTAAGFPRALFVATEPGHNFLSIYKVDVKSWVDFKEFVKLIVATPGEHETIVIDTVDILYKMCEQAVLEQNKVGHASDLPFGKGFSLIKDEFSKVVTYLGNHGFGLVFISHAKEKEMKTKTSTWTVMTTSLNNQAESFLCGMCDFIFYCYINEKGERLMKTKAEKYVNAGSRGLSFPSPMEMSFEAMTKHLTTQQLQEGK